MQITLRVILYGLSAPLIANGQCIKLVPFVSGFIAAKTDHRDMVVRRSVFLTGFRHLGSG